MISNDKSLIELAGTSLGETDKAVRIDFGDKTLWVPKSQMEDWPDVGETGEVLIKEWIAIQEELI